MLKSCLMLSDGEIITSCLGSRKGVDITWGYMKIEVYSCELTSHEDKLSRLSTIH